MANKSLKFYVVENDVPTPFELKWKVLNRGALAKQRNQVRGQIIADDGHESQHEKTNFKGPHLVECYAIKNGVVVARAYLDVPIQ